MSLYCEYQVIGTFRVTGYPVVMSLPHFYLADDEYLDGVVGLNPTQEKHEVTLLFEPVGEKL